MCIRDRVCTLSPRQLSFNWGLNPVTSFGPGPASARWEGKLLAPATEKFHLFIRAQGGFRLFLDHKLVIDAVEGIAVCCERLLVAVAAVVKRPQGQLWRRQKLLHVGRNSSVPLAAVVTSIITWGGVIGTGGG